VALAGELQSSALAHVATSTSNAYVGPWNAFVSWCNNLLRPRRSFLPRISRWLSICNHL
jgi:hypothetical protein